MAVREGSDGVIVGSALIDAYADGGLNGLRDLATDLSEAVHTTKTTDGETQL
jgi:tryptophan synthase alpha subunit